MFIKIRVLIGLCYDQSPPFVNPSFLLVFQFLICFLMSIPFPYSWASIHGCLKISSPVSLSDGSTLSNLEIRSFASYEILSQYGEGKEKSAFKIFLKSF
jgi:hypothetical protein